MLHQESDEAVRNWAFSQRLVHVILNTGARHAVLSPGSRNTPIVLALVAAAEQGQLQLHNVLDERQAGFLALGLARVSKVPVVLSCTSGTAGAHYWPAIAEANQLGLPLIALTADRPVELQGRGAPQTMDQVGLFGRHVRSADSLEPSLELLSGERLERRAWNVVRHSVVTPGPVHLNLRFRKPLWSADLEPTTLTWCPSVAQENPHSESDFREAFAGIAGAERGVVLAGPREMSADGSAEAAVLDFARQAGWPVLAEPASGLQGPEVVFGAEAFLPGAEVFATFRPDCILRIGRSPTAKSLSRWMADVLDGNTVLVEPSGCLLDGEGLNPLVVNTSLEWAFSRFKSKPQASGWLGRWRNAETSTLACLDDSNAEVLWAGTIVPAVWAAMGPKEDLHVASSMAIRDVGSFARLSGDGPRVSANRGTNGIDGTIACAVGQAVASGRPTTVLLGDLALLHDQGALGLIGESQIRVIVVDNGGGGIFEYLPIAENTAIFEKHFLTPHSSDIPAIARAHGLNVQSVESLSELKAGLVNFKPGLMYLRINRAGDFARHQAYWQAVCSTQVQP
jgi:2-succinyl-5-enolpyruvyl-6-hydroxy-3-cyclohexene-1-carboxylate synthase